MARDALAAFFASSPAISAVFAEALGCAAVWSDGGEAAAGSDGAKRISAFSATLFLNQPI